MNWYGKVDALAERYGSVMQQAMLQERILAKLDVGGVCWEWGGAVQKPQGYGIVKVLGRVKKTHRVLYELLVGPLTDELKLDHVCRNVVCANPDHLEPVPQRINVLRGSAPAAHQARLTVCPKCGGPYALDAQGRRRCLPCRSKYNKAYREAHA